VLLFLTDRFLVSRIEAVCACVHEKMSATPEFRLMVWGYGAVGKSALTIRFVSDFFVEEYDATFEDAYRKQMTVDGSTIIFDILDCAGGEDYSPLYEAYVRHCDAILLIYDVARRSTFGGDQDDGINYFFGIISNVKSDVPVVLCGNKCDLSDQRQVETTEGKALADSHGWAFIETSAKTGENVTEAFCTAYRHYRSCFNDNETSTAGSKPKKCIIC